MAKNKKANRELLDNPTWTLSLNGPDSNGIQKGWASSDSERYYLWRFLSNDQKFVIVSLWANKMLKESHIHRLFKTIKVQDETENLDLRKIIPEASWPEPSTKISWSITSFTDEPNNINHNIIIGTTSVATNNSPGVIMLQTLIVPKQSYILGLSCDKPKRIKSETNDKLGDKTYVLDLINMASDAFIVSKL